MDFLKTIKELSQMKSKAAELQNKLKESNFVGEEDGTQVIINGLYEIKKISIGDELYRKGPRAVENALNKCFQKAQRQVRDEMEKNFRDSIGMSGLGGLLGH